jgi:hypothetical protein
MALRIYEQTTETAFLSVDDTFDNPFSVSIDGRTGGVLDFELYIRNDDTTKWYDGISISGGGEVGLTTGGLGFSLKFKTGNKRPTTEEWGLVGAGVAAAFSDDIGSDLEGDTTVYLPFWIRIEIPSNQPASTIKGIKLTITATEHLI